MKAAVDVRTIEALKGAALKQKYREVLGVETKSNNRPFLVRKIVEALQHQPTAPAAKSKQIAETRAVGLKNGSGSSGSKNAHAAGGRDPRLPPIGTVLEREHEGKDVRVKVLENGFEFRGKTYTSLSTIANEATGTTWNGFLFFRLIPYARRSRRSV